MQNNPFNKLILPEFDGEELLYFNLQNSKLVGSRTAAFSIPAGYTCPGAKDCLAWFDRKTNKLRDGKDAIYRCFAASMEAAFSSARNAVDRNLHLLQRAKTTARMADLIDDHLPSAYYTHIRVHADGDFYNQSYFLAWMEVARRNPRREFYAYTKNIPIWLKFLSCVPENFTLTASLGGKWDALAIRNGLRTATVVYHPDDAKKLGLKIEKKADELAKARDGESFALLLHGQQPAGSDASKALKRMRTEGVEYSYGRKK